MRTHCSITLTSDTEASGMTPNTVSTTHMLQTDIHSHTSQSQKHQHATWQLNVAVQFIRLQHKTSRYHVDVLLCCYKLTASVHILQLVRGILRLVGLGLRMEALQCPSAEMVLKCIFWCILQPF